VSIASILFAGIKLLFTVGVIYYAYQARDNPLTGLVIFTTLLILVNLDKRN